MPSIVALDLGTQRVKAAIIKGKAGKLKVASFHARELSPTDNREAWLSELRPALEGLARELGPGSSQVVAAIPAQMAILRNITVPFTSKVDIAAVLPGQIESQLPVPVEDVVLEYAIAEQDGGESQLFVAAIPKLEFSRITEILRETGFSPSTVSLDIFALAQTAGKNGHAIAMENTLVLDLGAGATKAIFLREGRLVSARAFSLGGKSLTAAIESELGLGNEAAETMKVETQSLPAVSSEKLKDVFSRAYGRISREATMFLASLGESGSTDSVLVTGGGSIVKGMESILSGEAGPEVRRLELPAGTEVSEKASVSSHAGASLGVLVGSCLPHFDAQLPVYNFLRENQSEDSEKSVQNSGTVALLLVCIILGLLCFRFFSDQQHLKQRILQTESAQQALWKSSFPENPELPAVRALDRFDDRIEELRRQSTEDLDAPQKRSALFTVLEVLRRVPEDGKFILYRMNVTSKFVSVSGETTSLTAVHAIQNSLNESQHLICRLSNADKPSEIASQRRKRVRFQFQIELKN